jgi:cytochrome c-type biogenesis protein
MRSFARIVSALVVPALAACAGGSDLPAVVEVGQPAPDYAATALTGDSVKLASLRGNVVLLNVWATWCNPCRAEIPYLEELHKKFASNGLRIIGVSIDAAGGEEGIASFAKEIGMTYPIWRDPDQDVMTRFLAVGVPASFLIDREGVLRWKHVGIVRPTNALFTGALSQALAEAPR